MIIKDGSIKLDKPTKEIYIVVKDKEGYHEAKIIGVKIDESNMLYITVE